MPINEIIRESTVENPLGFFTYFFLHNGFKHYHQNFFSHLETLYDYIEEVNPEEEYIAYCNNNDQGITKVQKKYFKDELKKNLIIHKIISCKFIDQNINSFIKEEKQVVPYLLIIIGNLNHLIISVGERQDLSKHTPIVIKTLSELIKYLYDAFNPFFKDIKSPCIDEALVYLKQVTTPKPEIELPLPKTEQVTVKSNKKSIIGFNWKCRPESKELNTILLYDILKNNKVIQDDNITIENFRLAFSGSNIDIPLRIKWLLAKNGKHPKPIIIRIIKQTLMDELKVIKKMDNGELARALTMIFVDSEGTIFKNMIVTLSQYVSEKSELIETALINEIKSAPFLPNPDNIS